MWSTELPCLSHEPTRFFLLVFLRRHVRITEAAHDGIPQENFGVLLETTLRLDHEILLPHLLGGGLLPVGEAPPWTRILQQKRREAKNVDVRSEGACFSRENVVGKGRSPGVENKVYNRQMS